MSIDNATVNARADIKTAISTNTVPLRCWEAFWDAISEKPWNSPTADNLIFANDDCDIFGLSNFLDAFETILIPSTSRPSWLSKSFH